MTQYNDFDENDGLGFLGSIGPKAAFFIVLIALSFMIGLVWKLYTGGGNTEANVPIVRADQEGFKIAPDERGGMDIPYQDSTLFNNEQSDDRIENLLADNPSDEPPVPRSQLFAGLSTEGEEAPDNIQSEIQDISVEEPQDEGEERIVGQAKEAEKIVETIVVEEPAQEVPALEPVKEVPEKQEAVVIPEKVEPVVEPAPKPVQETKRAPDPAPTTPPPSGDYYIQLASVQSKPAADAEWKKFVQKYSPALNGFSHRVEMADLGAKGVYYRIQAGPTTKSRADQTCASIKKTDPNGCLVKKN